MTSDLIARIHQHKSNAVEGFTKKYKVHDLVYFEPFEDSVSAITREKTLKHWPRQKKLRLIEAGNPLWWDLYETLF